jgi:hypothetical protein
LPLGGINDILRDERFLGKPTYHGSAFQLGEIIVIPKHWCIERRGHYFYNHKPASAIK